MSKFIQERLSIFSQVRFRSSIYFWLFLSLVYGGIYAYVGGLRLGFAGDYVIQDDGRQHIYWMMQYVDPELFPRDFITDYFQSVAPWGYAKLYQLWAVMGGNPVWLSKILPLVLGLVATAYCFGITLAIFPVPVTGFIAASLLNQALWMNDNLASATARAFVIPLFSAFLYYVIRQKGGARLRAIAGQLNCVIALIALFYPTYALMASGVLVLQLINWRNGKIRLTTSRQDYLLCGTGLTLVFCLLLPFALGLSEFSPVISLEQAKELPEFYPGGRSTFFWDNPWIFWLWGRGGLLSIKWIFAPLLFLGFLLPIFLIFPRRFPLTQKLQPTTIILVKVLIVSLSLFTAAHLLLFELHLPSRYTQYVLPLILSISGAIVLTVMGDKCLTWIRQNQLLSLQGILSVLIILGLSALILLYPGVVQAYPQSFYIQGNHTALYEFLKQQPKDITIASITEEADNIPSFAHRAVFVSRETAIPYHLGYYNVFRQRVIDTIEAQYSEDLATLQTFNQKNNIDYWLLKPQVFDPNYLGKSQSSSSLEATFSRPQQNWLQQYQPIVNQAQKKLEAGQTPALAKVAQQCTIFDDGKYFLVEARCLNSLKN